MTHFFIKFLLNDIDLAIVTQKEIPFILVSTYEIRNKQISLSAIVQSTYIVLHGDR